MYINVLPDRKCCVSMVLSGSYWGGRGGAPCDITQGEIGANINTSAEWYTWMWCITKMTLVRENLCLPILKCLASLKLFRPCYIVVTSHWWWTLPGGQGHQWEQFYGSLAGDHLPVYYIVFVSPVRVTTQGLPSFPHYHSPALKHHMTGQSNLQLLPSPGSYTRV